MLGVAALVLASGVKGFFENPAYLLGLPLVLLGILGALAVLTPIELRWPERGEVTGEEGEMLIEGAEGHPDAQEYVRVGLFLAVLTAIEVAVYYVDAAEGLLLAVFLALTVSKFALVALWFMHLKFDNRLFAIFFAGGLALVSALLVVVLATLGASLV